MTADSVSDRIRQLHDLLDGTDIEFLEMRTPQETIRLRRDIAAVPVPPLPEPLTIVAPVAGVFLHRHPSQDTPLLRPGQAVQAGDVVGLVRIGALLMHLAAPRAGVIVDITAEDGSTVGYGAALLRLAPREDA
jgi:acetyl-CoA carboxylase biotin carboxyl carrier protein